MRDQISRLRMNAQQEKHLERARVYKRALDGLFIGTIEMGSSALEDKNFADAARLFDVAIQANPDSQWAWRQLAVAHALSGKKKEALSAQDLAFRAADLSIFYRLAMADAIIYATALHYKVPLITSDAHFANLPGVTLI